MVSPQIGPTELQCEDEGAVRWLFLNRPEQRNAFDDGLVLALETALDAAQDRAETRALVIAGRGPSFSAGADLALLLAVGRSGGDPVEFLARLSALFTRIESFPKPVVAAVHGHAIAGGLELALSCDAIVAEADAIMGDGHVLNGLVPAGGSTVRLARALGDRQARWLLLTGELRTARDLANSGLLHSVVTHGELFDAARIAAHSLGSASGAAQSRIKSLLASSAGVSAELALQRELDAFRQHWRKEDVAGHLERFLTRHSAASLANSTEAT